ncbi:uncharacterized protein BXZ73DRAFT_109154 [Epithele typhae]|uniref:uncharacterized protein n=1 Tax=Epithele typhae TaxID=378194 RepID=UPI00200735EE|nr:uncharacterized protein BXZ73DRAFT_109154 [Epithele typhae]KAH9910326.1 hypothetical protein BXZ73DRAFT_109154 [Epithele typhae]
MSTRSRVDVGYLGLRSSADLAVHHSHTPDPSQQSLFDPYCQPTNSDQSFCSDFSCCGQSLPDLHRLLEHFEEEHVLPIMTDDIHSQAHQYSPYILSYPQPDPHSLPPSLAYLNPNGLKYHLEKGTCTNADTHSRAPLPALGPRAPGPPPPATPSA